LSTYFGADTAKGRRQCREYVNHSIEGEIENPFEEVVHQSILGTADFIQWVRQKLPQKGQREVPSLKKLQHDILSVERILGVVAKAGNAQAEDLRDRKTKDKDLGQMAMGGITGTFVQNVHSDSRTSVGSRYARSARTSPFSQNPRPLI
jgi:hypothetical protein